MNILLYISILFCVISIQFIRSDVVAQAAKSSINELKETEKWIRATIGLECVISGDTEIEKIWSMPYSAENAAINNAYLQHQIRGQGSAIFFKQGDKHFLISARHMLIDETRKPVNNFIEMFFLDRILRHAVELFSSQYYSYRTDSIRNSIISDHPTFLLQ